MAKVRSKLIVINRLGEQITVELELVDDTGYAAELNDIWGWYSSPSAPTTSWEDGGKLNITDVAANTSLASAIKKAFEKQFGNGTKLLFSGVESGEVQSQTLSQEVIKKLITEKKLNPGDVITSESLTHTDQPFVLSNASNAFLNQDIGFKGIKGATKIEVTDGRKLTLVGAQASMAAVVGADDSFTPSTAVADTDITLTNGTLALGIAPLSATEGTLQKVTADADSKVEVNHGFFKMTELAGEGTVTIAKESSLEVTGSTSATSITNAGTFKTANTLTIAKRPAATTYADAQTVSGVESFVNEKNSTAIFGDLVVEKGGTLANAGTLTAGAVTVDATSSFTNGEGANATFDSFSARGIVRNAGNVKVNNTMTATTSLASLGGLWRVAKFAFFDDITNDEQPGDSGTQPGVGEDGSHQEGGEAKPQPEEVKPTLITNALYADELDLQGGSLKIVTGATMAGKTLKGGAIGSQIEVEAGGRFGFSYGEKGLKDLVDGYKGAKDGKAIVALSKDLTFKEGGSLTVGTVEKKTGAINLGENALLLVGTTQLHGEPLLSGKADQALHAEEGATIAFADDFLWGNHYVMTGFDSTSMDEVQRLGILDKDGNALKTQVNGRGVFVTVGSTDIRDKNRAYRLSGSINAILDGHQDITAADKDVRFLTLASAFDAGVKATQEVESFSHDSGALVETLRQGVRIHETTINHAAGSNPVKGSFWAQGIYATGDSGSLSHGYGAADYDVDTTGFAFGADAAPAAGIVVGAAFTAQRSDLEATKNRSAKLTSDMDAYGISVYGAHTYDNGVRASAALSYLGSTLDAESGIFGEKYEASTDSRAVVFGVRAEKTFAWDQVSMTPFIGFDVVHARQDGFTAKMGGEKVFDYAKSDATIGRVPVGFKTAARSGSFVGSLDLSVTPQFGSKSASFLVRGRTYAAEDGYSGTVADDVTGEMKVGFGYVKDDASFELSYGALKGNVQGFTHSLNAKARFAF